MKPRTAPSATARPQRRRLLAVSISTTAAIAALTLFNTPSVVATEAAVVIPAPADDIAAGTAATQTAVFAGGCFWGVQGVFQHVRGVSNAVSGYAGGDPQMANYSAVSAGRSRHAEAVRISYDPRQISYGRLLQVFFSVVHDPTQLDRQGPDTGPQYRSAIFPLDAEQMRVAKNYIAQLDAAKVFPAKIVTSLEPAQTFHAAEDYHQDYLKLHPTQPYIVYNDLPKIENFKRVFAELYRERPVLVGAGR